MIMKTAPNVSPALKVRQICIFFLFMSNPNQVMILNRKEWTVKIFNFNKNTNNKNI